MESLLKNEYTLPFISLCMTYLVWKLSPLFMSSYDRFTSARVSVFFWRLAVALLFGGLFGGGIVYGILGEIFLNKD